jgi:hypothetical protein
VTDFIAIQLYPGQFTLPAESTSRIIGGVVVSPYNRNAEPKLIDCQGVSTLLLPVDSGDMQALTLGGFADAVDRWFSAVQSFVDERDPEARASLVSYLPVPAKLGELRKFPWQQDAELARELEDKRNLARILDACGAPKVPCTYLELPCSDSAWRTALAEHAGPAGKGVVVQLLGLYAGGRGTFVVPGTAEFDHARAPGGSGMAKVMPRIAPSGHSALAFISSTEHGCEISVFPFSTQLLSSTSSGRMHFVGNRTPSVLKPALARRARELMTKIATQLYSQHGFAGLVGMDFVCDETEVYVVDINPRATALFGNYSAAHDAHFPGESLLERVFCRADAAAFRALEPCLRDALEHTPFSRRLLSAQAARAFQIPPVLRPGIYRLQSLEGTPSLSFLRSGDSFLDILDPACEAHVFPLTMSRYREGDAVMLAELQTRPQLDEKLRAAFGDELEPTLLALFAANVGIPLSSLQT